MKDLQYRICIEPNLEKGIYYGEIEISFYSESPLKTLILNSTHLEIHECQSYQNHKKVSSYYDIDFINSQLIIKFPKIIFKNIRIVIYFIGKINPEYFGVYQSDYTVNGETKHILTTHFQASDASTAFPCFDHPSYKSIFKIEFIVDKEFVCISNAHILEEIKLSNNKKHVKFAPTPPMCTYLVYFGIGNFEILEELDITPLIRVITVPGKKEYGKFALNYAKSYLKWMENYTGVSYPLKKCDLIAIPNFPYGGMENFGAIIFREELLLFQPKIQSIEVKTQIKMVLAHEIAHQWFGNLVSITDWSQLWIIESFATYTGHLMLLEIEKDKLYIYKFLLDQFGVAFQRDILSHSIPLITPGKINDLNLSTAPIIYAKSAALLYYFSHVIGLEKFQEAINQYFKNSVINAKIIGEAFQKYNIADSISFSNVITNWILYPSFPLVEVFQKTPRKIIIKQSQFSPIGFEENNIWNIPIKIGIISMNDDLILENILLKDPETEFKIPIKFKFIKLNWGQEGYYRIKYNDEIKKKLYNNIQNNNLAPEDRFGIHNDMIALVYAGKISLKDYLFDIETFFSNESHFFPLEDMLHNLNNLFVLCQESRNEISFVGSKICENFILRTNFFNLDKLNPNYEKLKNTLILSGFYFQIDEILSKYYWRIEDFYSNLVKSKNFPLNAFLYSLHKNSNLQNDIIRNLLDSNYNEEEAPQLLNALAFIKNFNKIKIIIFQLTKMKNLHALYTFLYDLSNNHYITANYWNYIKKNVTKIIDIFQIPLLGNFVVDIIPKVGIINIEEAISLLNLINDRIDNFDDVIDMSKDKLFLNFQLSIQK